VTSVPLCFLFLRAGKVRFLKHRVAENTEIPGCRGGLEKASFQEKLAFLMVFDGNQLVKMGPAELYTQCVHNLLILKSMGSFEWFLSVSSVPLCFQFLCTGLWRFF
jgi:hypothetical protein